MISTNDLHIADQRNSNLSTDYFFNINHKRI